MRGTVTVGDTGFYRVTCDYCGYTMLYDVSVIQTTPYRGNETEILPGDD